jgi:NDP-sugar pyrophosphorylase family protein
VGTGGAVRKALNLVDNEFSVLYGDTYLDIDYLDAFRTFKESKLSGLMTVLENSNQWDKSNILFRDGRIEIYDKKHATPEMKHIDYGLIFLHRSSVEPYPLDKPFDLTDVFQKLIAEKRMAGYEVFKRFYEIGTPSALAETEAYLRSAEAN